MNPLIKIPGAAISVQAIAMWDPHNSREMMHILDLRDLLT